MAASDYAHDNPENSPCQEGGVHRWESGPSILPLEISRPKSGSGRWTSTRPNFGRVSVRRVLRRQGELEGCAVLVVR